MKRDRATYQRDYWENNRKVLREKDKLRRHSAIVERTGETIVLCFEARCLGCRECFKQRIRYLRMRLNSALDTIKTLKPDESP